MSELGLPDVIAYRTCLDQHPEEWSVLDSFCRISIFRFYRDRRVFDALRQTILPEIARRATARGQREVHVWSAGCASGEEPYTLSIIWRLSVQPAGPFHLILFRNLVFIYCDVVLQADLLAKISRRLQPGGYLVVGIHESLTVGDRSLIEFLPKSGIYEQPLAS